MLVSQPPNTCWPIPQRLVQNAYPAECKPSTQGLSIKFLGPKPKSKPRQHDYAVFVSVFDILLWAVLLGMSYIPAVRGYSALHK